MSLRVRLFWTRLDRSLAASLSLVSRDNIPLYFSLQCWLIRFRVDTRGVVNEGAVFRVSLPFRFFRSLDGKAEPKVRAHLLMSQLSTLTRVLTVNRATVRLQACHPL